MNKEILDLVKKEWLDKLLNFKQNIEVYLVGGCVRDSYLEINSIKDIDLLIIGLSFKEIKEILDPYGKIDLVGESFGVLKFKDKTNDLVIDISIPRKERKIADGHKGFEIIFSEEFTLEDDLIRRDFTINTLAYNLSKDKLVDLFGGIEDLKNKKIKVVNEQSFIEDPLRILRGIQFRSRFKFNYEDKTLLLMQQHFDKISQISKERVLEELKKGFNKGCHNLLYEDLTNFIFFEKILSLDINKDLNLVNKITNFSDFLFLLIPEFAKSKDAIDLFYKNINCENKIREELMCLNFITNEFKNAEEPRYIFCKSLEISNIALTTICFQDNVFLETRSFILENKLPLNVNELKIVGGDLITIGFKPGPIFKEIKETVWKQVLKMELANDKQAQIEFIIKKYKV